MSSLVGKSILSIEDTDSIRVFMRISLMAHGATFYEANTAEKGLALQQQHTPDLVVLDLGLPDRDGLEILPLIKNSTGPRAPKVVILSVRKEQKSKDQAFQLGADAYVTKPFLMEDLLEVIQRALAS